MPRSPSTPDLAPAAGAEVDPELVLLPRPPQKARALSLALMIVTALFAALLGAGLFADVRYALASGEPEDVGELAALSPESGGGNRFIRGRAALDAASALRYETVIDHDTFELAPVAGNHRIWVEMGVSGAEPQKLLPPTTFVGRLVPLNSAAFWVRSWRLAGQLSGMAGPDAWVLIDGANPASLSWAIGLFGLLVVFFGYNLVTIARIVRPVR